MISKQFIGNLLSFFLVVSVISFSVYGTICFVDRSFKTPIVVAPIARPYDVTIYVPEQGPRTVVVRSSKFEFKEGCFISYAPKFTIECQVLEVTLCTENCNPSGAPPQSEEVTPEVAPSVLDSSNLVARS